MKLRWLLFCAGVMACEKPAPEPAASAPEPEEEAPAPKKKKIKPKKVVEEEPPEPLPGEPAPAETKAPKAVPKSVKRKTVCKGEATSVHAGCLCSEDSVIHNPCKSGGEFPEASGSTCTHTCDE